MALLHCDVLNIMDSALEYAMDLALELHCDHPRLMLLLLLLLLSLPPLLLLPLLLLPLLLLSCCKGVGSGVGCGVGAGVGTGVGA